MCCENTGNQRPVPTGQAVRSRTHTRGLPPDRLDVSRFKIGMARVDWAVDQADSDVEYATRALHQRHEIYQIEVGCRVPDLG